jgi:hypothetical protein
MYENWGDRPWRGWWGPSGPPWWIDAPYWYVLGAETWAEELGRQAWLDDVRDRLGLVLREEQ